MHVVDTHKCFLLLFFFSIVWLSVTGPALGQITDQQHYQHSLDIAFNEQEFVRYKNTGTASLTGKAFLRTEDKQYVYPQGPILLIPETPYTRDWFNKFVIEQGECHLLGEDPSHSSSPVFIVDPSLCRLPFVTVLDDGIVPYVRSVKASASGEFEFTDLPPGQYFLATVIAWIDISRGENQGIAYCKVQLHLEEHLNGIAVSRD